MRVYSRSASAAFSELNAARAYTIRITKASKPIHLAFSCQTHNSIDLTSFSCLGRLRCRFERSPDSEHAGTETFVIRVVDVLSPMQYVPSPSASKVQEDSPNLTSVPRLGELLPSRKEKGIPWSHTVSKSKRDEGQEEQTMISKVWDVLLENEAITLGNSDRSDPRTEQT